REVSHVGLDDDVNPARNAGPGIRGAEGQHRGADNGGGYNKLGSDSGHRILGTGYFVKKVTRIGEKKGDSL
ncbi:MAG: hypothetical protein AABZ35_05090, partial [Gemmatimonadota bacterium]